MCIRLVLLLMCTAHIVRTRTLRAYTHSKCGYNLFLIGYMSAIGRPTSISNRIERSPSFPLCHRNLFFNKNSSNPKIRAVRKTQLEKWTALQIGNITETAKINNKRTNESVLDILHKWQYNNVQQKKQMK